MIMDRMREAPARLLIDRASGASARLYWGLIPRYFGPLAAQRNRFYDRVAKEEDCLDKMKDPEVFSVREQLVLSRTSIHRRATRVRPRLKGG